MLIHPVIDKLKALKLQGMAEAAKDQLNNLEYKSLSFEERLGLLVDVESVERENRRLKTRLKKAKFRQNGSMQDIDYSASRGLDKSLLLSFEACQWISSHKNIIITGATGTGKSFLAEALGHNACLKKFSSQNLRLPTFFNELTLSKADGSYLKLLTSLNKFDVLILDDFGLAPLNEEQRRDLLEIVENRYNQRSTIITSQLPVSAWHEAIGDATLSDAILDRLVHNSYRIELKGDSLRKKLNESALG